MIADRRFKYIFTTGKRDLGIGCETGFEPSGIYQFLYDLQDDPGETQNLAYEKEFIQVRDSMAGLLLERFIETHPFSGDVPKGLNKIGKLIWFNEPNDIGDEPGKTELERIFKSEYEN